MIPPAQYKSTLEKGDPLFFPKKSPGTITAQLIIEAAKNSKKIQIKNTVITGLLDFRNATVDSEIILLCCKLQDGVDFSYSSIKRNLTLSFCKLDKKTDFRGATFNYDLEMNGATFNPNARFDNVKVEGNFSARRAQFKNRATFADARFGPDVDFGYAHFENADFDSARFEGSAHFDNAVFHHMAEFGGFEAKGDLNFGGSQFLDVQNGPGFDVLRVDGDMSFASVIFQGDVSFDGTRVLGAAGFEDAKFVNLDFSDFKVDGNLVFEDASIKGKGIFVGMAIGGGCIFRNADFSSVEKIRFDLTHFCGGAFFQGVKFAGDADFRGVQIDLDARFSGAVFAQTANFEASTFTGLAEFKSGEWKQVQYSGPIFNQLSLKHTRFEHDAHFDDATFSGKADFRDTAFRVIYFAESGKVKQSGNSIPQFGGDIDLRGCTYKAIICDWRSLLPRRQPNVGYNRQPYAQLEKFFTDSGRAELADEVYLEGRKAERLWMWDKGRYVWWFGDFCYWIFLRYGVRPVQLLAATAVLLMIGTIFFSQPHAIQAKDKKEIVPSILSTKDAFEFSLRQFLPVEIPLGENWIPSSEGICSTPGILIRPTTFASFFLRMPGWILVPLGIASFTRLLRKGGSKSTRAE